MAYVNFNRGLTRAQIEALTNAVNGKIYFATDGGIYVGKADGTAEEKADINDRTESKTGQEFVYRKSPATIKAKSLTLDRIYGKTLAWNQLTNSTTDWNSYNTNNVTKSNGVFTVNVTGTDTYFLFNRTTPIANHKYYLSATCSVPSGVTTKYGFPRADQNIKTLVNGKNSWLITYTSGTLVLDDAGGTSYAGTTFKDFMLVDLTLMFGAGNEPSTVAEFEALYPGYHDFGNKLISNDAESLETTGFNKWDEEWVVEQARVKTKNYIPVIPGSSYYLKIGSLSSGSQFTTYLYDNNKNLVQTIYLYASNTITIPSGVSYMYMLFPQAYGGTYNHDICINISDPAKNGTYEPYRKSTMPLNLNAIKVYSHNIWDEEWINGDGAWNYIVSKNYCPIKPSTTYYCKCGSYSNQYYLAVLMYDKDMNQISYGHFCAQTFTTPSNAAYFKIKTNSGTYIYGGTYNNDICINESGAFNGQYEPHGILTIEGGLRSVKNDTVCDELVSNKFIRKVGDIDLGDTTFQSGGSIYFSDTIPGIKQNSYCVCSKYANGTPGNTSEAEAGPDKTIRCGRDKRAYLKDSTSGTTGQLSGVMLYFELATPIEYELAEPIVPTAAAGTTEERISPNADGLSAPFCCDMTYSASENNDSANAQYAATAGRLLNTHKLWGQDFNGTEDVSGALSGVTTLTASDAVTAGSFVKSGGTSSQFLKADGSVDSNTYALNSSLAWNKTQQGGAILVNSGATASDEGTIAYGKTNIADIIASGIGSQAGGFSDEQGLIKAQGNGSRAMGVTQIDGHIIASGHASEAIGFADSDVAQIIASGVGSYARGCGNDGPIFASGKGSTAIGAAEIGTIRASGKGSIAIGNPTGYSEIHAKGNGSFAHGYTNAEYAVLIAYGASSHAEGAADAESISGVSGYGTSYTSSNSGKLSVGDIVFSGFYIAQVVSCTSSSFTTDVTLGSLRNTTIYMQYGAASGDNSHSEGRGTRAIGYASHSEGYYTTAQNAYEHAMGKYNASHKASTTWGNAGNTLHSIGIGTGSSARVNAVEVMQNGDVYINSTGNYDGTNPSTADTLQQQILVLTEHIAKLTAKINTLEAEIDNRGNLTANTVDVRQGYTYNGDLLILTGSGAPTTVPAFVGQFYINTSGPSLYYAINNSAASDWKQA